MAKRKVCLNRPKRKSYGRVITPRKCVYITAVTPDTINYSSPYKSPRISNRKRVLTPMSSQKKSRKRLNLSASPCENQERNHMSDTEDFDGFEVLQDTDIPEGAKEFIEIASDHDVLCRLSAVGLLLYFTQFFKLVQKNKYPLTNIALLLWIETVRWYNCLSEQSMWYFEETKRFWKAGYRLFHGKFLSFMSGPKALGKLIVEHRRFGSINPSDSEVNFVVPSRKRLISSDSDTPTLIKPGVITQTLSSVKASNETNIFMMCVDGKKVTPGVDTEFGDVDMFGFEQHPTASDNKDRLDKEKQLVDDIKFELSVYEQDQENIDKRESVLDIIRAMLFVMTMRIKESREIKSKQEYGLEKLKERAGKEWKTSKYLYAISGIQAFLYRLGQFIDGTLKNIYQLCKLGSELNTGVQFFCSSDSVDPCRQGNMYVLKECQEQIQPIPTFYIKQRTDMWHTVRSLARVTGSTMHNAIGLRSLKDQKEHFDRCVLGKEPEEVNDTVKTYMDHGTKNEPHAQATLVGRFMPLFYPDCVYVEEGCYLISSPGQSPIEVSPDGSIRTRAPDWTPHSACISAVEIKCPFPKENKSTVLYKVPTYYVCQCLCEIKALNTDSLIFVCYSRESTTFFSMLFDEDLWSMISDETQEVYDVEGPRRPTKLRSNVKMLKEAIKNYVDSKVQLLVEMPSIELQNTDFRNTVSNESPYHMPLSSSRDIRQVHEILGDIHYTLNKTSELLEIGHQLSRKKANEVMVWVLSNKDRYWSAEKPNSVPIAYGLKDYKFSSQSLRDACNYVLSECKKVGIQVPLLAFDGQWYSLMVRDGNGNPLTKLQLQKDIWNEVLKLKKKDIVNAIKDLNRLQMKDNLPLKGISITRVTGQIIVESTDRAFKCIKYRAVPRSKAKTTENVQDETEGVTQISWLPESVLRIIEEKGDNELLRTLGNINKELDTSEEINVEEENQETLERMEEQISSNTTEQELETITFEDQDYENICANIRESSKQDKWTVVGLKKSMTSAENLNKLTRTELDIIAEKVKEKSIMFTYKKSWVKAEKVNAISKAIGDQSVIQKTVRRKNREVPSLKSLSEKVINSSKVSKSALNIGYAEYIFPARMEEWKQTSMVSSDVIIEGCELTMDWYSHPEWNSSTEAILCKCLDSHHLLTNLRTKTSTTGLDNISPDAWKRVAQTYRTKLTPSMVDDLIDKQSNSNAQTHFSEEVENVMVEHGDMNEASFCRLIRQWYEAEDAPSLGVIDRINRWLTLKEYLLQGVNFASFPPQSQYIKGLSLIPFEGFLTGIDTKIQLYSMCGSYCVRTASSLPAETCVGGIQGVAAVKSRPDFISVLLYFSGPSGSMTPILLVLRIEYRLSRC